MEPFPKKAILTRSPTDRVLIRLCDAFTRTDGDIICPLIKAENSVRVLYKLQENVLYEIVHEAGARNKLIDPKFVWKSTAADRKTEGSLFVQYCTIWGFYESIKRCQEILTQKLREVLKVKTIVINEVQTTEDTISQPIISEIDFEVHNCGLCSQKLLKENDPERLDALDGVVKDIREYAEELKEYRVKIAVLSQNGKGKSFFLNLLLLMTSDNNEEYQENNRDLMLPKDIPGDPTVKEVMQSKDFTNLPDVIKSFIETYKNTSMNFKAIMTVTCHELHHRDYNDLKRTDDTFKCIPKYFTKNKKLRMEPYILPQKNVRRADESTTKCNIHLRYGKVYQVKVEYFTAEELQNQLFELVSLKREETGCTQTQKLKCLKEKFSLLTNYEQNEKCYQLFHSYEDITLSEEVKQFVGRTEFYIGSGKDSTKDRLALKKLLQGLISSQDEADSDKKAWKQRVAAIKEIVAYIPSKILYNKEIIEMPGSDDSDSLAMYLIQEALNKADGVFLISEYGFKIAEKEIKEILVESEFIKLWKRNPELYALMLLTYPEKDPNFQYGKEDTSKVKELEAYGKDKRTKELETLRALLDMDKLSNSMEESIFSTLVLPVLHTSIHAQKGHPNRVLTENAEFLKYTGIHNLIIALDTFLSTRALTYDKKVENRLFVQHGSISRKLSPDEARQIFNLCQVQKVKTIRTDALRKENERLLCNLNKQLTDLYKIILYQKVEMLLENTVNDVQKRWEMTEKSITSMEKFNPLYRFKGKLSKIIFGDLESHKAETFKILMEEIDKAVDLYKDRLTELLAEEIKQLFDIIQSGNINSEAGDIDLEAFVKETIQDHLTDALRWYKGYKKMPINEKKISECWERSKIKSLTECILKPAYKLNDLQCAKKKVKENIQKAVLEINDYMKKELLSIHTTRWKSLSHHLKGRHEIPQMWYILIDRIKSISTNKEYDVNLAILNVLKLMPVPHSQ